MFSVLTIKDWLSRNDLIILTSGIGVDVLIEFVQKAIMIDSIKSIFNIQKNSSFDVFVSGSNTDMNDNRVIGR